MQLRSEAQVSGAVERRVALPRLEHAMIEIQAAHLGQHDHVVDALGDGPRAVVQRVEARS